MAWEQVGGMVVAGVWALPGGACGRDDRVAEGGVGMAERRRQC